MNKELRKKLESLSKHRLIDVIEYLLDESPVELSCIDECPCLYELDNFYTYDSITDTTRRPEYCSERQWRDYFGEWEYDCDGSPDECWIWHAIDKSRPIPLKEFASDGCSGYLSALWKKIFKRPPPFEQACMEHDYAYWKGAYPGCTAWNNFKERLHADNQFFKDMWYSGLCGMLFAAPCWIAVRLGGGAYWKMPYSWGFGWRDD